MISARRILCTLPVAALLLFAAGPQVAHANEKELARLEKLSKKAMESFDLLDYEAAKKLLNAAVAKAKTSGLENEPLIAQIYLNLGIVYFAGENDMDSARVAFIDAVKIDPSIQIDPAYRTDDMQALLDEIKGEASGGAPGDNGDNGDTGDNGGGSSVDCSSVEGLSHELLDTTRANSDLTVTAALGSDVDASKVSLHYRMHGVPGAGVEFVEIEMTSDGCKYRGVIPGEDIQGGVIHYYISAYQDDQAVASKGNERTPNIIEVIEPDNPFGGGSKPTGPKGPAKIFISVAAGTGAAFVTGQTEQLLAPVNAGLAPALLHIFPEIGYFVSPKTSISLAFRLGFPIGANRDMHAGPSPAATLRWRQSLSEDGNGLFWAAALGGGVIRQTVELTDVPDPTMNVDTTAIGPLFVGGGAGYKAAVAETLFLVTELGVLAGIPLTNQVAGAVVHFGVQFDLNVALMVAF